MMRESLKKNYQIYLFTKYIKRVLWGGSGRSVLYIGCVVHKGYCGLVVVNIWPLNL